jgi:hypothetical protein
MSQCLHLSNLQPKVTKDWPAFVLHVQVIPSMVSAQRWANLTEIFCVTEEYKTSWMPFIILLYFLQAQHDSGITRSSRLFC